jgi:putative tRNA adenosine deaminase-associated protein
MPVEGRNGCMNAQAGSFAVVAVRDEGGWEVGQLPDRLVSDLDGILAALRQQVGVGGAIALVDVADEFFVAVRVVGDRKRFLLSDVTAAAEWELAGDVLSELGLEAPTDDELDDIQPAGDLAIFADYGLDEVALTAMLSDVDAYADEILLAIAQRLGFAAELEPIIDSGGVR